MNNKNTSRSRENKILLKDLLNFDNLSNVKIRFNQSNGGDWNPIEHFKDKDFNRLLDGQYWNYSKTKSYKEEQVTVGFIRIEENLWLLFHVGKITKDLNKFNGAGYEYKELIEYEKYFGRLIVKFKNNSQNMIRNAESIINECEVWKILPDIFDNDIFPGYENVRLSWREMNRVVENDAWRTALENQKGIYLIADKKTGDKYVGSAYGDKMILGRWQSYLKTGHGGNAKLKELVKEKGFDYIKENFYYSILDIYNSKTNSSVIIDRESWWKETLNTRDSGYNSN